MEAIRRLALLLFLLLPIIVSAEDYKPPRILFILDASSQISIEQYKIAETIILGMMDRIYQMNTEAEFALRAYGHQYPAAQNQCDDNQLEVPFSKSNYGQMSLRLSSLQHKGISSAKLAMEHSFQRDFTRQDHYHYAIVLITGSGSSCDEDVCTISGLVKDKTLSCEPLVITLGNNKVNWNCIGRQVSSNTAVIPIAIEHYKSILAARDRSFTSNYGFNLIKQKEQSLSETKEVSAEALTQAQDTMDRLISVYTQPTQSVIIEAPTITIINIDSTKTITDNGFGYIKVGENLSAQNIRLYFQNGNASNYILFDHLNISSLLNGQIIWIRSGYYKIEYTIDGNIKRSKRLHIKNNMVTEIKLN